jgi:hypothetical protein
MQGFYVLATPVLPGVHSTIQRYVLKTLHLFIICSALTACLTGCTVLAIADAAGSALVYGVKTTVNVLDAITPDLVNKKKE